jgi:hypothetical protein
LLVLLHALLKLAVSTNGDVTGEMMLNVVLMNETRPNES